MKFETKQFKVRIAFYFAHANKYTCIDNNMYNNKSKSIKRVFHLKSTFILAHCWHAGLQPAISWRAQNIEVIIINESQQPKDVCLMGNKNKILIGINIIHYYYWPMSEVRKWNLAYKHTYYILLLHLDFVFFLSNSISHFAIKPMNRMTSLQNWIFSEIRNNNKNRMYVGCWTQFKINLIQSDAFLAMES